MSARRPKDDGISPALVQLVENNLLLQQAIADLKHIKATQEMNHIIAVELRDHKTIEKADKHETTIATARWLFGAIVAILGVIGLIFSILYVTHSVFHWPA